MLILSVLLFYVINDYKIIVIGKKEKGYIMSEVIVALKNALLPIQYTYPIIFASISENHRNYIDAPVPSLILLWGTEK